MNIFVRMVFLFLSFSGFAQAIDQETNNNFNEPGSEKELELTALKAFVSLYREIILFETWGGEVLSRDEFLLLTTAESNGNDSKTIFNISIRNLLPEQKEKIVNHRIDKAAKLYYELLQLQLVKNAKDLTDKDNIIFENLLKPSAYCNTAENLDESIEKFKKLANVYKNISSQMKVLELSLIHI